MNWCYLSDVHLNCVEIYRKTFKTAISCSIINEVKVLQVMVNAKIKFDARCGDITSRNNFK